MRFSVKTNEPSVLCKVYSPQSGKFEKNIFLRENLHLEKAYEGNVDMIGRSSRFDISADTIFLFNGAARVFIELNMEGKVILREKLPYPARTEIKKEDGTTVINNLDTYLCMKVLGKNVYTAFSKNMGVDKKLGGYIFKTHLIQIPAKGKFSEKILDGQYVFIGDHDGILYLFNLDDYMVESIKIAGW